MFVKILVYLNVKKLMFLQKDNQHKNNYSKKKDTWKDVQYN